ncbi:MAG TPA: hypothetical protein GXZ52_00610 [Clostridiales bacterium]|jgi:hypothetical protein|nr:hypothetical protein [Clostridiales bacterium]
MELKLKDGDYVADASGELARAEGIEELAQRVVMKLTARRGGFPLMPDYGSRLYKLPAIKPSQRLLAAQQYVIEALEGEEDLHLRSLDIRYLKVDWMELELVFDYGKEALTITTRI